MTGVTWGRLWIGEHKDSGKWCILFETNCGEVVEEFSSERAAVREYKRMFRKINRTKPSHTFQSGMSPY